MEMTYSPFFKPTTQFPLFFIHTVLYQDYILSLSQAQLCSGCNPWHRATVPPLWDGRAPAHTNTSEPLPALPQTWREWCTSCWCRSLLPSLGSWLNLAHTFFFFFGVFFSDDLLCGPSVSYWDFDHYTHLFIHCQDFILISTFQSIAPVWNVSFTFKSIFRLYHKEVAIGSTSRIATWGALRNCSPVKQS